MSKNKEYNSFWKRWRLKYRLVVLNSENLEELISLKLSRINIFLVIVCSVIFLNDKLMNFYLVKSTQTSSN